MENGFVTYEQAVKLKELGFDESCFGYYENGVFIFWYDSKQETELLLNCSAPLKQQVFRWFREKYNLLSLIFKDEIHYWFEVEKDIHQECTSKGFDSYEEAENACIDKLISLIEAKN